MLRTHIAGTKTLRAFGTLLVLALTLYLIGPSHHLWPSSSSSQCKSPLETGLGTRLRLKAHGGVEVKPERSRRGYRRDGSSSDLLVEDGSANDDCLRARDQSIQLQQPPSPSTIQIQLALTSKPTVPVPSSIPPVVPKPISICELAGLNGCFDSSCYLPNVPEPKCTVSPYGWRHDASFGIENPQQGQCFHRSDPTLISETGGKSECLDSFQTFQNLTGRPFKEHWKSWVAPTSINPNSFIKSAPFTSKESRRFSAEMDTKKSLYYLRNVCVRPSGSLMGYAPKTRDRFEGDDDVFALERQQDTWTAARRYIETIEEMPSPSSCFLDTKVIMVPLVPRSNNPGHVFQRMAAILDIRKRAWPEAGPENVTMMYVLTEGLTHRIPGDPHDLSDWSQLAFRHYTEIVAGSHFGVFAQDLDGAGVSEAARSLYGDLVGESRRALRAPVCFSEMVVYFTCTYAECEAARRGAAPRPIIPLFWQRSGALLEAFCDEVRRCGGLPARRPEPNRTHPTVLLSMRSRDRRWMLTPSIIGRLGAAVEAKGGRLIAHEMRESGTMELARLYSAADILIGPYGAGLFYGIFMPPGAVGVEIGHNEKSFLTQSGLDVNPHTDYGGNFGAMNIRHLAALFPARQLQRIQGTTDLAPEVILFLAEKAITVLRAANSNHTSNSKFGVSQDTLHELQTIHDEDSNGEVVRALASQLLPLAANSERMKALARQAALVSSALNPIRGEALHGVRATSRHGPRVLILTRCPGWSDVEGEIRLLQNYGLRSTQVFYWNTPKDSAFSPSKTQCLHRDAAPSVLEVVSSTPAPVVQLGDPNQAIECVGPDWPRERVESRTSGACPSRYDLIVSTIPLPPSTRTSLLEQLCSRPTQSMGLPLQTKGCRFLEYLGANSQEQERWRVY